MLLIKREILNMQKSIKMIYGSKLVNILSMLSKLFLNMNRHLSQGGEKSVQLLFEKKHPTKVNFRDELPEEPCDAFSVCPRKFSQNVFLVWPWLHVFNVAKLILFIDRLNPPIFIYLSVL